MVDKHSEELLTITARYIAELHAGQHPRLSDYLLRYPHLATEITDFLAYYHAVEAQEQAPSQDDAAPLSATSRAVLARVQAQPGQAAPVLPSLLFTAAGDRLTVQQLAQKLDVSEDVVTLLEERKVAATTIPHECSALLARILDYHPSAVRSYLAGTSVSWSSTIEDAPMQKVAETQGLYQLSSVESTKDSPLSFRQVLEASEQLSELQKARWFSVLTQEGL